MGNIRGDESNGFAGANLRRGCTVGKITTEIHKGNMGCRIRMCTLGGDVSNLGCARLDHSSHFPHFNFVFSNFCCLI